MPSRPCTACSGSTPQTCCRMTMPTWTIASCASAGFNSQARGPARANARLTRATSVRALQSVHCPSAISALAVPFMAVAYLLLAVGIILFNLSELPGVLEMVVKSAFGWHE
ncbi:alanine:cation symporter family protein, partial [Pseudomonas aeruginosa]|uniref:alanine:cation symporter family protein n=1 Tax=Pseudomonas aeruginosa TaxID=287 RepID=UPI0039B6F976